MASSIPATASTSASASAVIKTTAFLPHSNTCSLSRVSLRLSPKPHLQILTKGLHPGHNYSSLVKAQLNEFSMDGSSNASSTSSTKEEAQTPSGEVNDDKPSNEHSSRSFSREESISLFFSQVASLAKLVDSRDIVELEMKQLDCELLIRKKEALPQPPSPAPAITHSPSPPPIMPPAPRVYSSVSSPPPTAASSSPSPLPAKSVKYSHPPLKSPMAGTFYRSPAPGEPPFVKVGDQVQKGQVVCVIEAMKLMNEIEANRSGTIAEILVEDGKPVSVDTPLYVIEP